MDQWRIVAVIGLVVSTVFPKELSAQGVTPDGFVFGGGQFTLNVDTTVVGIHDNALRASMGREQQIKPAFFIVGLRGYVNPYISFRVEINPVRDDVEIPREVPAHQARRCR